MSETTKTPMTKEDASRIQSAEAKSGNDPEFAKRAQAAGDKNANAGAGTGKDNKNTIGDKK